MQGVERAGPDRGLPRARRPRPTIRRTSASPRPHKGLKGIVASMGSPCCCRRGSATRSAGRSRPNPTATARARSSSRRRSADDGPRARSRRSSPRVRRPHDQRRVRELAGASRAARAQMPAWRTRYPGVENMTVAVMACVVNGPANRRWPTSASACRAPARRRSRPSTSTDEDRPLKGDGIAEAFGAIVADYARPTAARRPPRIYDRYGKPTT